MYLIGSIGLYPQSAVTLYIYRVGKIYPARNLKNSNYNRIAPKPVRPVGPTGQTGRSLPDWPQCLDRSDRLVPILPVNTKYQQGNNISRLYIGTVHGAMPLRPCSTLVILISDTYLLLNL